MPGLFPSVSPAMASPESETPWTKSSIKRTFEEAKTESINAASSGGANGSQSARFPDARKPFQLSSEFANGSQSARQDSTVPKPPPGRSSDTRTFARSSLRAANNSATDTSASPNAAPKGRRGSVLYIPKDSELGKIRHNETVQGWIVIDVTLTQSKKLGRVGQCDPFVVISRFDHIWTKVTSCTAKRDNEFANRVHSRLVVKVDDLCSHDPKNIFKLSLNHQLREKVSTVGEVDSTLDEMRVCARKKESMSLISAKNKRSAQLFVHSVEYIMDTTGCVVLNKQSRIFPDPTDCLCYFSMEVDGLPKAKYFGHSNPFLEFYTKEELPPGTNPRRSSVVDYSRYEWQLVHQTEVFHKSRSPHYKPFTIRAHAFCGGFFDRQVLVKCKSWRKSKEPKFIGEFITNVRQMLSKSKKAKEKHEKRELRDSIVDENETQGVSLEDAQKEILRQKLAGRDRRFFLLDPGKKQADNDYAHSGFVTIREAHLFTPASSLIEQMNLEMKNMTGTLVDRQTNYVNFLNSGEPRTIAMSEAELAVLSPHANGLSDRQRRELQGSLTVHFRGIELRTPKGFIPSPFVRIMRYRKKSSKWEVVAETEIIEEASSPIWEPLTVKLKKLLGSSSTAAIEGAGDIGNIRILFTVLSEGRGSAPPSYMGEFLLTYAELKTALNKSFRVVDTKSTRERDIGMLTFDSVRYTGSGR